MFHICYWQVIVEEAKGTFLESWANEFLASDGTGSSSSIISNSSSSGNGTTESNSMVDNLLQQLNAGDLRTQVSEGLFMGLE